jgi:hypothetical protein
MNGNAASPWEPLRAAASTPQRLNGRHTRPITCYKDSVDRRLAMKNLRVALVCALVSLFIFAASFFAASVY